MTPCNAIRGFKADLVFVDEPFTLPLLTNLPAQCRTCLADARFTPRSCSCRPRSDNCTTCGVADPGPLRRACPAPRTDEAPEGTCAT